MDLQRDKHDTRIKTHIIIDGVIVLIKLDLDWCPLKWKPERKKHRRPAEFVSLSARLLNKKTMTFNLTYSKDFKCVSAFTFVPRDS